MDKYRFLQYVEENFSVSGEAMRLINNILTYVENNFYDENEQYEILTQLLDGAIGLSDSEIKQITL